MSLPLPLVVVEGTPGECGVAYGRAAADLIGLNTASYLERFASFAGLDRATVRRYGALFREASHQHAPRVAEMLDGVAEGADVDVNEIYALNGRSELMYAGTECTAIGVLDTRSVTGHALLAQNWDWHPAQRPYSILLATRDERGSRVLALTEAGMLAKAGLNDAGLGVCVNLLGSSRDRRSGGVPYHVLLRAVLEARLLGEAIKVACATPRCSSINLLIGQAFAPGVPSEVLDLEVVPGDVGVLHPVDGVITHANHLEATLPVFDVVRGLGGSTFYRGARARRLLGAGLLDEKQVQAVLADHGGYPQSICRHDIDAPSDAERTESLFGVLLDLDERRMTITPGPPCQADASHDIRLAGLFT
ncbi:C45 family autoproteolytic acyltransferase/hydrolase [Dactylosporangium sucinum]|uniref:Acyl-CoA--6-aminopenicillanic acid acyl-transferase n=1 Tax=Dactylosporangium sucinum TaxID=1424081 RepID=A0A917TUM7_9ACTN|nr:C45 family peptidase [Dactylosporangium sucinum]GGM39138.1 acyl-CoA--6-aminopenicillanic acid acyl-transferase [Dactylosporangium sucinum]